MPTHKDADSPDWKQPDESAKSIGKRIRDFRQERELSLSALEAASGVSKGYLSQLENDSATNPSIDTLRKIAEVLGVSSSELLGEQVEEDPKNLDLPPGLAVFVEHARAEGTKIAQADIEMLRAIKYRGKQPKRPEDWAHLYELIRRDAPNWGKG